MDFKTLMQRVAAEYDTTPEEVEKEIRIAIKETGYDMEPEEFILFVTAIVKSQSDVLSEN